MTYRGPRDEYKIFANRLRSALENAGVTQVKVAEDLDFSKSMMTNYVQAKSMPESDRLYRIAEYLNVDPAWLFGANVNSDGSANLQNVEKLNSDPSLSVLMNAYRHLNDDGKQKVSEYAEDLRTSGKYSLSEDSVISLGEYTDFIYEPTIGTAAAGNGFAYCDDLTTYRVFMATEIPEHDFSVNVSGNSMMPSLFDGDVAFVKKSFDKVDKRIYVIDIDGETVIKRVVFGQDKLTLISDNPDWVDRKVVGGELENTRILGVVVGWETPIR